MATIWLTPLILLSGALHIRAEYRGPRSRVYLLKPLTTSLIVLLALLSQDPISGIYKWSLVAGLLLSLGGDVFLMLPQDHFLAGLSSFLLAHLAYILAFTGDTRGVMNPWLAIPFLLLAFGLYLYLSPHLDRHRIPVLIYALIICSMAWAAWGRWLALGGTNELVAAIGSLLFLISDFILAYDRFRRHVEWGQLAILSSYYLAQLLLASSI
jgi:uncharacterized membrane protein YhhN